MKLSRLLLLAAPLALALAPPAAAQSIGAQLERHPDLIDAAKLAPELQVELRYATTDNFLKQNVYGNLDRCFLNRDAAAMLGEAQAELMRTHPDLRLHVFDCARPASVQMKMWNIVKGTPSSKYVASPKTGSIHSYGCAVDLTVARQDGTPLDMGTPYDHFGPEAEPRHELELLQQGVLTGDQIANRLILREVMLRAGFRILMHEWWHFDCATQSETRRRYRQIL